MSVNNENSRDPKNGAVEPINVAQFSVGYVQTMIEFHKETEIHNNFLASCIITQSKEEFYTTSHCPIEFKVLSTSIQLEAGFFSLAFLRDHMEKTPIVRVKAFEIFCYVIDQVGEASWNRVVSFTGWDLIKKARVRHHFEQGKKYFFSLRVFFENELVSPLSEPQQVYFYPSQTVEADKTGVVYYKFLF